MIRPAHALQPDAQLEARTGGPRLRLYSVDVFPSLSLSQYSPYEIGMRVGGRSSAGKNISMKSGNCRSHERSAEQMAACCRLAVGLRTIALTFLHSIGRSNLRGYLIRTGPQ